MGDLVKRKAHAFWIGLAGVLLAAGCAGQAHQAEQAERAEPADGSLPELDGGIRSPGTAGQGGATGASDGADAGGEGSVVASGRDGAIQAGPSGEPACSVQPDSARCDSRSVPTLDAGSDPRRVYWALPTGAAPEDGYPAVVLYQGSIYGPSLSWDVDLPLSTGFGGYYQVVLIAELLDAGFVVIQPEASGGLVWNTNAGAPYETTSDAAFIPLLLAQIGAGEFGEVDMTRLYAAGISSGGYMTSRMAVSYPGRFAALAIQSGSYATCLGPLCSVPAELPADHPPTLLLHGAADTTVPIGTARAYETVLKAEAIETRFVEDPTAGHQWLDNAPEEITRWFMMH